MAKQFFKLMLTSIPSKEETDSSAQPSRVLYNPSSYTDLPFGRHLVDAMVDRT